MLRLSLIILSLVVSTGSALAQVRLSDVVSLSVIDGGQRADGKHLAALRIVLKDGWKTYWRVPGEAGIPPSFSWKGSHNLSDVQIIWPTPTVFSLQGYRSIGYKHQLVLPLVIEPDRAGVIRLSGEMDFGVCSDVCVPARLPFSMDLDPAAGRNAAIAAAMAQRPFSADEAGVRKASCRLSPTRTGLHIETRIDMPKTGRSEVVVVEPANPKVWASDMKGRRSGGQLVAEGNLEHETGQAFAVSRSKLRITVLGRGQSVEILGCDAG